MAERNIECMNVMISALMMIYCSLHMKQETFVLPYMMKPLHLLVWICDCRVVLNLCTLNTQTVCPPDRRVWVSHCVNCRSPQILMNASHFSPSGTTHTSFVMPDLMEDVLLRIFSCRQDTPEFSWFSRTVEDTLYRNCDYMIKEQESWRFHSTRDNYSHIQLMKPFPLFELQQPKLYFHFLNDGF